MTQPSGSPSPIRRCLADRLGVELRAPRWLHRVWPALSQRTRHLYDARI